MTYVYPDDGHIYVCVRVRDVVTPPTGMIACFSPRGSSAREATNIYRRICVSTIENIVVMHDPRHIDNTSLVARDADGVVGFLTTNSSSAKRRRVGQALLTPTASASYFECDMCLNSMDTSSMMLMPLIRSSDFISPPERCTQEDVYLSTAAHAVKAAVEGVNSCVFAYGQTGSGKTYTLFGDTTCIHRDSGVVTRTIDDLFQRLEKIKRENQNDTKIEYSYRVQFSFFEIYHNEVFCLLSRKGPLRVSFTRDRGCKEEAMVIHDLRQHFVESAEKSYPLVQLGLRRRQTGETGMNAHSSRSHAILQIRVRQWRTNCITKESVELSARITLVDLAGSERQKTAKTDGKSRDEGIQINQSLATLARVINEISRGAKYVSYRDSLLTMVLKDNLGGNSKTFMIATISPISFCYQESCATLQYAKNVRKIRNRPIVNKKFQTRSNLLELNALLKKENEHLRHHISELLKSVAGNTIDDVGTYITDNLNGLDKVTGVAKKYGTAITRESSGAGTAVVVTEAVIAAPGAAVAPLVVTACRKYTNVDGIGTSCVLGDSITVKSLAINIVKFSLTDILLSGTSKLAAGAKMNFEKEKDYGVIEFERLSERSIEHHYWVRYVPPSGTESVLDSIVNCQINGQTITSGDRRELVHGDVICIFLDGIYNTSEQILFSFHYVDINCLSRRDCAVAGIMEGVEREELIAAVEGSPAQTDAVVERLLREEAKLKDMLKTKERVIEYQCQREAESRSRVASMTNCHHREDNNSRSPSPVLPHGSFKKNVFVTTPLQANAAAYAFQRMSATQSVHSGSSNVLQEFDDGSYRPCTTARAFTGRSTAMEELMRRLEELEKSVSQEPDVLLPTLAKTSVCRPVSSASVDSAIREVSGSEVELSNTTEGCKQSSLKATTSDLTSDVAKIVSREEGWDIPTADELLLKHRADPDLEQFGNMHLYMATSDGVCERYKAALRERVLCERIFSLERTIKKLEGEVHLLESKLRVAGDVIMEHEVSETQLGDEVEQMSKTLLEARNENTLLLRDINSLETFIANTEKALAEATSINEIELERRSAHLSKEVKMLKDVATMWKRRALSNLYFKANNKNDEKNMNDVDDDDYIGVNAAVANIDYDEQLNNLNAGASSLPATKLPVKRKYLATASVPVASSSNNLALEKQIKKLPTKSGNKNSNVNFDPTTHNATLEDYKKLVERLCKEKEQLEIENNRKAIEAEVNKNEKKEIQRLKLFYTKKCNEIALAEKKLEEIGGKLQTENKKKITAKQLMKKNNQAIEEQQRLIEEHLKEHQKLCNSLKLKDEELSKLLHFMRVNIVGTEIDGFKSDKELRDRIEVLLENAMKNCSGNCGFSAFPPDIEFSEELIAIIRISLRIMLDRLKIELYVLNRQSLHKFGLLVPVVQLRPDAQFRFFTHELRSVVAELAGKPQRIGARWSIEEGDVLSGLVDHRRRRIGNALNGLLIWYDHWDLAPKTEHVSYIELIRNSEHIMQLARLVRQESLVNTNATSSLRHMLLAKNVTFEALNTPKSGKDTSVVESRRILEKLTAEAKTSNLARVVGSGKVTPTSTVFQRSQTAVCTPICLRRNEADASRASRVSAALTSRRVTTGRVQSSGDKGKRKGDEGKFVRRATALVIPATENDIAAAASSALVRHGSTYNFDRQLTAVNTMEANFQKPVARTTRFARSKTDISHLPAALGGELTFRRSTHMSAVAGGLSSATAMTPPTKNVICTSRTSPFFRTGTCTSAAQQTSTRLSGMRHSVAGQQQQQLRRTSGSDQTGLLSPSVTFESQFYDPCVLKKLKQRSRSGNNELTDQRRTSLTDTPAKKKSVKLSSTSKTALLCGEGACGEPFASTLFDCRLAAAKSDAVSAVFSPLATHDTPPQERVEKEPIVPKLCFDSITK